MAKLVPGMQLFKMLDAGWAKFWSAWFSQTSVPAHTIPLAKLTGGGVNGSLTFNENGVITGYVDPT